MKKSSLHDLSTDGLVDQFAEVALQQYDALLRNELSKFNKLYGEMDTLEQELKARPGDQRRALAVLYGHPNPQVRLKAAVRSLAVDFESARRVLEDLASSRKFPQAGDAGMILDGLDRGEFKPT